ncbi:MAG: hypothetical protein ABI054_11715 [Planctomycetota bacterium]
MSARAIDTLPRKAGWIRRWAFRFGVVLLVLVVVLVGVYLGREKLLTPLIVSRAKKTVREATDLELEVDRIDKN